MGQDTARRRHVKKIFDEALERPPVERAAFLDSVCDGEPEVRARVERLLSMIDDDPGFLEEPPLTTDFGAEDLTDPYGDNDLTGKRLSHYDLRRVIATGGMGTVYEAVQEKPHRTVAVKVMKQGIASRSAMRRFEYESQILARLRHSGIAQVYEAGTYDEGGGVPYFVMEYVPDALHITEYAREKKLTTRQRLELFSQVCEAVHHGHQRGIIHRDLKPANILVDPSGQPKIIDFGVARATDSDMTVTTLQTDVGQLIGTLQYMSPEQCRADPHDLDTRSDVYALGVVLYELLCEQLPYDVTTAPVPEAIRVVREEEPAKPSTVNKTLRGDVETILLKALEKERDRRYQSSAELSADITRYVNSEPIAARPPSVTYQLRKFAQRNRGLVGGAAAVLLVMVIGSVAGALLIWKEREQTHAALERADANFRKARDAVDELLTSVGAVSLAQVPQAEQLRKELLEKALVFYLGFLDDQSTDPGIRYETARAHQRIGDIYTMLCRHEEAEQQYRRSISLLEEMVAGDPTPEIYLVELGRGHARLGNVLRNYHRDDEAAASYRRSLDIRQALYAQHGRVADHARRLADTWNDLAILLLRQDRPEEAEEASRRAVNLIEKTAAAASLAPEHRAAVAGTLDTLGDVLVRLRRMQEAEAAYRQALQTRHAVAELFDGVPAFRQALAHNYMTLGRLLISTQRTAEAESPLREALSLRQRLAADFPSVPAYRSGLAEAHTELAMVFQITSRPDEAERSNRAAVDVLERLAADHPDNPNYRSALGRALNNLGRLLIFSGRPYDAAAVQQLATASNARLVRDFPDVSAYRVQHLQSLKSLGHIHCVFDLEAAAQYYEEAIDWLEDALVLFAKDEPGWEGAPPMILAGHETVATADYAFTPPSPAMGAELYESLGQARWEQGRLQEAHDSFHRALTLAPEDYGYALAWFRAICHDTAFRDPQKAIDMATTAIAGPPREHLSAWWKRLGVARYYAGDWPGTIDALGTVTRLRADGGRGSTLFVLAMAHARLGDEDQARSWYELAIERMEAADPVFDGDVFLYPRLRREAESILAVELGDRGQDGTLAGDGVKPAGDSGLQTED